MRARNRSRTVVWAVCLFLLGSVMLPGVSQAKTAREIDASVNAALNRFTRQVKGSREFLQVAKGVLVFADVYQAGAGIGVQYGEGALRIRGKTVAYYSISSASIGFQLGAQASLDTTKFNQPIVGFVVGQQGLMYNLTLEGSKISKMRKQTMTGDCHRGPGVDELIYAFPRNAAQIIP